MRADGLQPSDAEASPAARALRTAGEVFLLALVVLSPWPLGSADFAGQLGLSLGIFLLVTLWAAHAVVARRFAYRPDPVAGCLLGLIVVSALQLVPLPKAVVRVLSPAAAEWHRTLIPDSPELLPGEAEAAVPRRRAWQRLSVAPAATEDQLGQFLAVFLIYAAARNFAVHGRTLRRLAWVGFATGACLSLLAICQYLSGDREQIYWSIDTGGPVFGPFVNKNHFAFQIELFAGLGIGLFLWVARRAGPGSPAAIGLLGGLGLMVAAVGISQSRGGVIALAAATALTVMVARLARREAAARDRQTALVLLGGVAAVAVALIAWLGWEAAIDRLASVWHGTADNRTALWRRDWVMVQRFPLTGVGGGGYSIAELAHRTAYDGSYLSTTAHNEYLEALIEGGVVRLALTLGLAVAAVWAAAGAYRKTRDPLLLGCVFGLAAVAVHSIGDFGLHVPSVALAAAVVAAAAMSCEPKRSVWEPAITTRGGAILAAAFLLFAAMLVVLANWRGFRVDRLRTAAWSAARPEDGVRYLEAAAHVRPNDPAVWDDLASAHLRAALERGQVSLAAVAGFGALKSLPDAPLAGDPGGHVAAALKAARAGRDRQPLLPGPHMRLGSFADRFARTDPPAVHFARAKRVNAFESDVWFVCGTAAADQGDWPEALADWREALTRSPLRLRSIVRAAAGRVPDEEFRTKGLPDDPTIWLAAARILYPDGAGPGRATWMRAIADRSAQGSEPETPAGFAVWATALEELGDAAGALRVWRRAADRFPDDVPTRDRLAALLEADEQYEDALPVLEWLTAKKPDDGGYKTRLAAARHALKLKADIDRR